MFLFTMVYILQSHSRLSGLHKMRSQHDLLEEEELLKVILYHSWKKGTIKHHNKEKSFYNSEGPWY